MHDFFTLEQVLEAAGIDIPLGPQAQTYFRKVVNDGLVQKRALELAVNAFLLDALRGLTGPEKDVLRKRIGVIPKQVIQWAVIVPADSGIHQPGPCFIRAWVGTAGTPGYADSIFDGKPEAAALMFFRGEQVPEHVVQQYVKLREPGIVGACEVVNGATLPYFQPKPVHYPLPDPYDAQETS